MKLISVISVALACAVAVSAQEKEEFVPQMHRRLVEVKSKNNNARNRNRNLRGDHKGSSTLLDALDEMPVPKPVKTKIAE